MYLDVKILSTQLENCVGQSELGYMNSPFKKCKCVCVCVRDLVPVCVHKYEHEYVCITRATLMRVPSGLQVLALVSRSLL